MFVIFVVYYYIELLRSEEGKGKVSKSFQFPFFKNKE
jgi:hypothetical protein